MNAKKYLVAAMALNTVLLAFAVSVSQHRPSDSPRSANNPSTTALTGRSGKFGPVIDTVLPAATQGAAQILDLETGRTLLQPPLDDPSSRADSIMSLIRSNGLDISCSVWSGGANCVTYDMTIVPVESKSWDQTTEQDLLANPALAPVSHSPRKLLMLGHNNPDTYAFRTAEGTLGMLKIDGLDQHQRGVKIRYKLINPAQSIAANP